MLGTKSGTATLPPLACGVRSFPMVETVVETIRRVGIYRGVIIPGFLRCKLDFAHPKSDDLWSSIFCESRSQGEPVVAMRKNGHPFPPRG